MPLFVLEMQAAPEPGETTLALALAAQRFPEVAIEQRYADHGGDGQDLWVCTAPSRSHLQRWAAATGIPIHDIRHVDALTANPQAGIPPDIPQETP